MELKTPLYDVHVEEGGKIVPFAGYLLPVQYPTGVIREHMAVRTECGLFDVSHMGEITFTGPDALRTLNHLLTNDFTGMPVGRVRYSVMCLPDGGCVDDVLVYKFGEDDWFVVVNASNRHKDFEHMKANLPAGADVRIEDVSDAWAQLALQGPKAPGILSRLADPALLPAKYYTAVRGVDVAGFDCIVSRTGYTGEQGFELYTAAENGPALWRALREAGKDSGLIPCGLGARDTLRLEAAMPLYGHEMDETITPLEAGLGFGVKLGKEEFIGRDALLAKGEPQRVRVGLAVTGRGIVREHQPVLLDGRQVGVTTSGTLCPFVNRAIAMAYVPRGLSAPGTKLDVDVRGRAVPVEVVPLPFYKRA